MPLQIPQPVRLLCASQLLVDGETSIEGGGLLLSESGHIEELLPGEGACRRAAAARGLSLEVHEGWLAPGFVCAHAHLDLGVLAGRVPAGPDFPAWIGALLRERASHSMADFLGGQIGSAKSLLRSGTTLIGDIDSMGLQHVVSGPRAVRYRELLDLAGDHERREEVQETLDGIRRAKLSLAEHRGLSPHAPYTSSTEWMRTIAENNDLPVAIHWAETEEEREWLEQGAGPFARLFGEERDRPRSAHSSGLDRIEAAGLLRRSTALIHANDPRGDEIERVARSEASVVHCPGAARFFDRDPFPLERWREAGVPVAIGTDSAAGNDSLSMLRELKLLRRSHPELKASECFAMATVVGGRALGLEGLVGSLTEGAFADLCLWPLARTLSHEEALERLTRGGVDGPSGLWIQGRARSLSH